MLLAKKEDTDICKKDAEKSVALPVTQDSSIWHQVLVARVFTCFFFFFFFLFFFFGSTGFELRALHLLRQVLLQLKSLHQLFFVMEVFPDSLWNYSPDFCLKSS
jgi:hypothetical protein